ncbi:membrane-anchored ubiquitin-fold protein 3-like [Primulina tabacum]|uniref:membrane-anchored ubiquitin-fold protein 3-like n=1 Tax=Primulina tabacum TaxID=48773 RepID=UPI003F5A23C7
MAEGVQQLELRFRIFDGTDICQGNYPLSTDTDTIKERLMSEWPQDKSTIPTSVDDMKIIHAGEILENGRTLAESRLCVILGEVVTMHVVVQPPEARRRTGRKSGSTLLPRALEQNPNIYLMHAGNGRLTTPTVVSNIRHILFFYR